MVFSSTVFVFLFLPCTLLLYFLAYKTAQSSLMNIVLLSASLIFYAWGGVLPLLLLLVVITLNYILTIVMCKYQSLKNLIFILIMLIDIGNLFYFKYYNFAQNTINNIAVGLTGEKIYANIASIALPIGISFYTFQIMSYVIDVFKGNVKVQMNYIQLMLYVVMFPQLIAGPIVRYIDVNEEINSRSITASDVEHGIERFVVGFAKKVFLANTTGNIADIIFGLNGQVNTIYAWLGAICYTLQIYFDFSAYSDMAIGLGRILGFHFNENFDLPYTSESIQEFWRRWHISLSSWFRDYVYIPLGGNRRGKYRTYLNLSIVFLLTGIWHGAAWQFIIWGIYHGFFLIIERIGFGNVLKKFPHFIRKFYTIFVVIIGWVFFRADDLQLACNYLKNMFCIRLDFRAVPELIQQIDTLYVWCFIIAVFVSLDWIKWARHIQWIQKIRQIKVVYLLLWIFSVMYLAGLTYNPFIYFKF